MIPAVIDVRIKERDKRGFRIWLPFFLLWPLIFLLVGLAMVVSVFVDFLLLLAGKRYHHYTALLFHCLGLLGQLRGTIADIDSDDSVVRVRIV